MPVQDGRGSHDGDGIDHFPKHANHQSEQDAILRANARLGHRTPQHDDLLAKDNVLREEPGARAEGVAQRAQDGFEDFHEHRGANRTT
jgi:hypothetical protein